MSKNLCNVGLDKELLDMTLKSMTLSKIHKLDLTTMKKLCYVKQPVKSMRRVVCEQAALLVGLPIPIWVLIFHSNLQLKSLGDL